MTKMQDCEVRKMDAADLEQVLEWRNHPDVRKYMYTQHEITLEEHTQWFQSTVGDSQRHLLIFEKNKKPLGFVNITEIKKGGIADWGFYLSPQAPKGTGLALGITALNYAFYEAGFYKVCGQALGFNERSIVFHLKLGFEQEGILRDQHFDGKNYHDVVCFGLLANQWQPDLRDLK